MSYLYFACAAFFYACAQIITFGKFKLKGDFWQNWNRKYKHPLEPAPTTYYYKLAVLKYKERFTGSGTIFVAITDGFHLCQWFFIKLLVLSVVTFDGEFTISSFAIYLGIWYLVFNTTHYICSEKYQDLTDTKFQRMGKH